LSFSLEANGRKNMLSIKKKVEKPDKMDKKESLFGKLKKF